MADHEIRIHPTVNLQEIKDLERHLDLVRQQMDRIAGSAAKITIPSTGSTTGAAHGQAGRTSTQTGGGSFVPPRPGETTVGDAVQQAQRVRTGGARRVMEAQQQAQQARTSARGRKSSTSTAGAESAQTPGGLLNWIMSVFLPDQPTIQEMTGGAKSLNMSKLSPSLRAKMPTFQFQPSAWKSAPQTPSEYANAAAAIPGFDTMSPAAQKAAMDAAMGGYTPVNLGQLRKQGVSQQQALYEAYRRAGTGGSGRGGSGGLGAGPKALLGAAGMGGVTEMLGRLGPWGAAALGVGYAADQTKQGWSTYHTQADAFSALSKTMGNLNESFNTLRNTVNKTGLNFAESLPQITQVMQAVGPLTGNLGTAGFNKFLTASQGYAFSAGLNPLSTSQAFAGASQIGILPTNGSAGQMTPAQWAALIANSVSAGGMGGRQGQVLSSLLGVSQQIAGQLAQAPNEQLLASIMTGLNASGNPNLQGALGAKLLGSINSGIQNPGMGSLGQLINYQALNPNGKLGYFQEQGLQAQGLNGINPTTGVSNFAAELGYFQKFLPHGRVQFQHDKYGTVPTEQTALAATMFGKQLNISQPQALQVLEAFNGKSLNQANQTAILAEKWGGTNGLQTLLKKGGMTDFSEAVNAKGLNGRYGLNAVAKNITGNLGGTVNPQFYALEKQYNALGKVHPSSVHQATVIQHQRSADLAKMREVLGKSMLGGPSLSTSIDKLNTTMNKANAEWAKVAKELQPVFHLLAKANLGVASTLSHPLQSMKDSQNNDTVGGLGKILMRGFSWLSNNTLGTHLQYPSFAGQTTSYQLPGLSAQSGMGAVLASFTQGNNQNLLARYITASLMGTTNSSTGGGFVPASYTPGISNGGNQAAFVKQMAPFAAQVAGQTKLPAAFLLTQWADETGWGGSLAAKNNFGNIKIPGTNQFQSYSSPEAFAQADANFYKNNSRYQPLLQGARQGDSLTQLFQLLGQSGYATNPQYAQDLIRLVGSVESLLRGMAHSNSGGLPIPNASGI